MITAAQLIAIMPRADPGRYLAPLNAAMDEYSISANNARQSMFLAQVAEETSGLTRLEEDMDYSAGRLMAVWPLHFSATSAVMYAHNPEKLADFIYADKNGNGDEASGDGWLFHGRGGPMLTFRNNYVAAGKSLGIDDLATYPDQAATNPTIAMRVAAWFWAQIGGNQFADKGAFEALTRAWRGGLGEGTNLPQRIAYWQAAQGVLA
jgi:putative chitinase